jgi:hypothetical protein
MEVQGVLLITSVVMLKGTFLLSFGMSQGMNATKLVVRFSIHRSMVNDAFLLITIVLLLCIFIPIKECL